MSAHPHQTRGTVRLVNPMGGAASMAGGHLQPPPPTPILRPTEVKRQFQEHADFATYSKAIKKYLNGGITKTEFHAELSKVLPTKEKMALHNWLILSILKSAYSEYGALRKGAHGASGSGANYKSQNLRALSDHFACKKRMQRIAMQHQLGGITDDAVSMVVVAMQQHLLRSIAAMRATRTLSAEVEDPPEGMEIAESSAPGDISSNDVVNTIWRRPTILCENTSLVQTRLSVEQ